MANMKIEGEPLKYKYQTWEKRTLIFGLCLGASDDDQVLVIHRKREPAILGKAARREGTGNKIAIGTIDETGQITVLPCERELPAIANSP